MALQSSGQLIRMSQINTELGRSSTATISLDTAENGGYATINTCGSPFPSGANPASMSEWYGYNHSAACGNSSYAFSDGGNSVGQNMLSNNVLNYGTRVSTSRPNSLFSFSFSFWMKRATFDSYQGYLFGLHSGTTSAFIGINWISMEDPNSPGAYWHLINFYYNNNTGSGNAAGIVNLGDTNNSLKTGLSPSAPWDPANQGNVGPNGYSLITIVYDYAYWNTSNFIKFYWNDLSLDAPWGNFANHQSHVYGDSIAAPTWTNADMTLGGYYPSELGAGCQLDAFAFYPDLALTSGNISSIYNSQSVASTATYTGIGNVLLYNFENNTPNLGIDSGNYAMNLDEYNSPTRVADPAA